MQGTHTITKFMPDSDQTLRVVGNAIGRPSRSIFNRPARSHADLMSVSTADFPFVASWTVLGCAPSASIVAEGRALGDGHIQRIAWLNEIRERARRAGTQLPQLPADLELCLREYRINRILWAGPALLWLARSLRAVSWLAPADRALRKLGGMMRYTYRHGRKWLRARRARLDRWIRPKPNPGIMEDLTTDERALFIRLVAARNEYLGR